jgi:hypothetical protein
MALAAHSRHIARLVADVLAGRPAAADLLAPHARAWAPHRGWSTVGDAADLLGSLAGDLSAGDLVVDAVVAADDLVVLEAVLHRDAIPPAPVTATILIDAEGRACEIRVYLDPERIGVA